MTKMTIQNCIKLIFLHFPNNSLYSLNGGHIENHLPPPPPPLFPAATDPIQIASNLQNVPYDS